MTAPPLTAIDLFCGAGGMSLGLSMAGYETAWAIDADESAARTFAANFDTRPAVGDIREIGAERVAARVGGGQEIDRDGGAGTVSSADVRSSRTGVDLVVGGPPCPTHSHVGRNRLETVDDDDRHHLYEDFVRFVGAIRPRAFLMENVPGMTHSVSAGGVPVIEDIETRCEELGYRVTAASVDAANFGVPQRRERMFILGNRLGLPNPHLPAWRTHRPPKDAAERRAKIAADTDRRPSTGSDSIQSTLGAGGGGDGPDEADEANAASAADDAAARRGTGTAAEALPVPTRDGNDVLRPWNTVADALLDLPPARDPESDPRDDDAHPPLAADGGAGYYATEALTPYQRWVRTSPSDLNPSGDGGDGGDGNAGTPLDSHVRRFVSDRDRALYTLLGEGVGYTVESLPDRLCPHDTDSFPDKYRKLNPSEPSNTIIAHISQGGNRFVHPRHARSITVREAARLQSFPDSFTFPVAQTPSYRQIGNAVPPLLARALGIAIGETILDADGDGDADIDGDGDADADAGAA